MRKTLGDRDSGRVGAPDFSLLYALAGPHTNVLRDPDLASRAPRRRTTVRWPPARHP